MGLAASKINLIHELFVRTADENYVTARWCAINDLNTDFLWLAVHALEKYLKAVLLINGKSSKGYGHDIVRLYADVKCEAGSLLPDQLQKPKDLSIRYWPRRSADNFIANLLANGNADNRYLIFGYVTRSEDLHMLDQMVFSIRRLICSLDEHWLISKKPTTPTFTNRELLTRQPEHYSRLGMPLDDLISARKRTDTQIAALNLNMAFAPDDFEHTPMQGGTSARNPVIMRRILAPLENDNSDNVSEAIRLAEWFLENVQVPKGTSADPSVKEQIREAINAARQRHDLS